MVVSTPQDYRLHTTVCLPAASVNALNHAHIVRITCTQGQSAPAPIHARISGKLILPGGVEQFIVPVQLWGVSPYDPWTLSLVPILLLITGLVACSLPARRASRVDPLIALRHE